MFKKTLSLVLSFLLLHAVSFVPVSAAGSANEAEAARVEKVKPEFPRLAQARTQRLNSNWATTAS